MRKVEMEQSRLAMAEKWAELDADEVHARIMESHAKSAKLRQDAKIGLLQEKVTLLRERHKLLAEGVPQSEIDLLLPLTADLQQIAE